MGISYPRGIQGMVVWNVGVGKMNGKKGILHKTQHRMLRHQPRHFFTPNLSFMNK